MEIESRDFPLEPTDSSGRLLSIGNRVSIQAVASCVTELPEEDRARLFNLVGELRTIVEIDRFGFVWLSFSASEQSADFCLFPAEVLRA